MVIGGKTPAIKVAELERLGFKMVISPAVCIAAAVPAMEKSLAFLKEHGTDWQPGPVLGPMDIFRRVGFDWWHGIEDKFAGSNGGAAPWLGRARRRARRVLAATWLTGLSLATAFAAAAYGFGRSVEPERTDLISLAIFGLMGLASQAGLLLAPWATTRGLTSRIIAALLMGPAGVSASSPTKGFPRHGAGSPLWMGAIYLWGVLVYAVAYVALVRGGLGRVLQPSLFLWLHILNR